MKIITFTFFLLYALCGFSQTKTEISGRVLHIELPIKNADVVNFTTKKNTTTNENGAFTIEATLNDKLVIISSEYADKTLFVSQFELDKNEITIQLEAKPIELDEVKIRAQESVKNLVTYDDLAQIRIAKENSPLRNAAVYDGKMINSADFIQIAKLIGTGVAKLFKLDKKKKNKKLQTIDFKEYANDTFSDAFFIKILELKPDEKALFLNYCEADSKSKAIIQTEDEFVIMDFLISKKAGFLALLAENKK